MAKAAQTQVLEPEPLIGTASVPVASFDPSRTSPHITLSNNNLTATMGPNTDSYYHTALSTGVFSGRNYIEFQVTIVTDGDVAVGVADTNFRTFSDPTQNIWSGYLSGDPFYTGGHSISFQEYSGTLAVQRSGNNLATITGLTIVTGNVVALAVDCGAKTVQFRNVTTNSAWTQAFDISSIPMPYLAGVQLYAQGETATATFKAPFVGAIPPGYVPWGLSENTLSIFPAFNPISPVSRGGFIPALTASDITLSDNRDVATRTKLTGITSGGSYALSISTPYNPSGSVYAEITVIATSPNQVAIGVTDANLPVGPSDPNGPNWPGGNTNSVGYYGGGGGFYYNGAFVTDASVPLMSSGDVIGISVTIGSPNTVQFRNVTKNSPWSIAQSIATFNYDIRLVVSPNQWPLLQHDSFTLNLQGPFQGVVPAKHAPWAQSEAIIIVPEPNPPVKGVVQPQFTFGSATAPPASAAFPEFTTGSPAPPIVFSNIFTGGATPVHPPSTTTPIYIPVGTLMGPPIGPALPNPIPPRQFMAEAEAAPASAPTPPPMRGRETEAEPEPAPNGAVYDDTDNGEEGWFEDTSSRTPEPTKPKRGRRKK